MGGEGVGEKKREVDRESVKEVKTNRQTDRQTETVRTKQKHKPIKRQTLRRRRKMGWNERYKT